MEEQLHRKVGNNIVEDLEDSSAEQRDRERLEGGNASSRLEWQNVSIPSLMDATPTPCLREDTSDEGANGGDDERSQGTGVQ